MFFGCSDNAAKLIVYSPHGKELLSDFANRFEQKHPDVTIEWLDMGSQNVLDRIRSERSNPQADLWWGAPAPLFMQAVKDQLLEPYRPTWAGSVDSIFYDAKDYWYGTWMTPEVIMFNDQILTQEEVPHDWMKSLQKNGVTKL